MRTATKTKTIEDTQKPNTHWTSPKTNIFTAINDLRRCLASGYKARLIKIWNEDSQYPIKEKEPDKNFRMYKHLYGTSASIDSIKAMTNLSEFDKELSLNYVSVFGTPEAKEVYYKTGKLGKDSLKNMGTNYLVNVDDLIKYYRETNDDRANLYERQYRSWNTSTMHFFDFFTYSAGNPYANKKFNHRLWVVEIIDKDSMQPKLPLYQRILMATITALAYPLKYVPRRSVLKMDKYKIVTYRVGSVRNGYTVDIHIPNKFSFKD